MKSKNQLFKSLAVIIPLVFGLQACSVNEILPNAEFNTLMVDADAAIHDGRWELASEKLEQAARLQPKNLSVKLKQGRVLQKSGKLALAHNAYQQIIDEYENVSGKDREIIDAAREYQSQLGFKPLDKSDLIDSASATEAAVLAKNKPQNSDAQPLADADGIEAKELAPLPAVEVPVDAESHIRDGIEAWRRAWQEKRIDDYFSYYAADFAGEFSSPSEWRTRRKDRISAANDMEIEILDLAVGLDGENQATVRFTQRYRAAKYQDVGLKTIQLRKIDDKWLIVSERFRKE